VRAPRRPARLSHRSVWAVLDGHGTRSSTACSSRARARPLHFPIRASPASGLVVGALQSLLKRPRSPLLAGAEQDARRRGLLRARFVPAKRADARAASAFEAVADATVLVKEERASKRLSSSAARGWCSRPRTSSTASRASTCKSAAQGHARQGRFACRRAHDVALLTIAGAAGRRSRASTSTRPPSTRERRLRHRRQRRARISPSRSRGDRPVRAHVDGTRSSRRPPRSAPATAAARSSTSRSCHWRREPKARGRAVEGCPFRRRDRGRARGAALGAGASDLGGAAAPQRASTPRGKPGSSRRGRPRPVVRRPATARLAPATGTNSPPSKAAPRQPPSAAWCCAWLATSRPAPAFFSPLLLLALRGSKVLDLALRLRVVSSRERHRHGRWSLRASRASSTSTSSAATARLTTADRHVAFGPTSVGLAVRY